jgi:hypothetical protein
MGNGPGDLATRLSIAIDRLAPSPRQIGLGRRAPKATDMAPSHPGDVRERLTAEIARDVFSTLEERRRSFEQVMWQVPSLSIAAQAFLFSAAFGSNGPRYARVIVLLLGLASVLAALHLLAKHRYLESLHGQVESLCLSQLGWRQLYREELHKLLDSEGASEVGAARWRSTWIGNAVIDVQAFHVWVARLGAFAVADAYLLVRTLA